LVKLKDASVIGASIDVCSSLPFDFINDHMIIDEKVKKDTVG